MRQILASISFLLFLLTSCQSNNPAWQHKEALSKAIRYEMRDKGITSISIALVKDSKIIHEVAFRNYEHGSPEPKTTTESIYRIGSVSKLFTDIAIMRLVEKGEIDLDAPIQTYLPDFRPNQDSGKDITLRQLMSHRSGLLREPEVGNYFDHTEPSLAETVASFSNNDLVYQPEERTKYSNAGVAVVGYVLEKLKGEPFAKILQEDLLDQLQLTNSSFTPNENTKKHLVPAEMWNYSQEKFLAPTFQLGMAPAGSMYSTVQDLSIFMQTVMNNGTAPNGFQMLQPESLDEMLTPQFSDEETGFGLGFAIGDFKGRKSVGHGGAIYGFSTQLTMLPEEHLGVVIMSNLDVTNTVIKRLAEYALALELGEAADYETSQELSPEKIESLVGHYQFEDKQLEIVKEKSNTAYAEAGAYLWTPWAKFRLKEKAGALIVDDRSEYGLSLEQLENGMRINGDTFAKIDKRPVADPSKWKAYIGEYGWDHSTLYILERFGKLSALVEWTELDQLKEIGADTFAFPNYNMYHGESIKFVRDANGKVKGLKLTDIYFPRRLENVETGKTFTIDPVLPIDSLRILAKVAKPPLETGKVKADLVSLKEIHDGIKYDIRYATTNNFMQSAFYESPGAYLQRPAAEALGRVQNNLEKLGYGLLIHDAYRPWAVTKMFWDATPSGMKHFVADPSQGSRHNRGCAVDLTLYDLESGAVIEMVGGYDEFSDRSYPYYPGGTSLQRYHRDLLKKQMELEGFKVYQWEWWHFDFQDWNKYPILTQTFDAL